MRPNTNTNAVHSSHHCIAQHSTAEANEYVLQILAIHEWPNVVEWQMMSIFLITSAKKINDWHDTHSLATSTKEQNTM